MGTFLPFMTRTMAPGTYDIPRVECNTKSVVTNTTPIEAYRGAGRPEATAAIERAFDLFAREIGMDPVEVRRRNLIGADAFPFTTQTGAVYDSGDYAGALDKALAAAGFDDLRAEQADRRTRGDTVQLGIGVAVYVEITAGPSAGQTEFAKVALGRDGRVTVFTGSSAHGQGHSTAWAMLAHELTGIPMDDIEVVAGDTDRVAEGSGHVRVPVAADRRVRRVGRHRGGGRRRPARSRPSCSRPLPPMWSSTSIAARSTWPAHLPWPARGPRSAPPATSAAPSGRVPPASPSRRRCSTPPRPPRSRSARTWRWSRSTPRPVARSCAASSPATTPDGCSTR